MGYSYLIGRENDNGESNRKEKQQDGKLAQLDLQRSADKAKDILGSFLEAPQSTNKGITLLVVFLAASTEKGSNASDFRIHTSSNNNCGGPSLGDCGGGKGHVVAVGDANFDIGVGDFNILDDWDGFSGEKSLVGFEIHAIKQPSSS